MYKRQVLGSVLVGVSVVGPLVVDASVVVAWVVIPGSVVGSLVGPAVLLWVPVPVPASVVESLPSLLQAVARVAASVQQAKMDRSRR